MARSARQEGLGKHAAIRAEEKRHLNIWAAVDVHQSGYICGALIGQDQFTLQTYTEAWLALASTVKVFLD